MSNSGAAIMLAATAALLIAAPIRAQKACQGVPNSACADFQNAVRLTKGGKFDDALEEFKLLRAAHTDRFAIEYAYGRLLAAMGLYPEAVRQLQETEKLGQDSPDFDPAVYNALGFALLMEGRYEEALESFAELDEKSAQFSRQPKGLKMKAYNNSGVAYLQLDRYEEARVQFKKAQALGSKLAEKNLAKIASILETLEKGDDDVHGIFAVIVKSARDPDAVPSKLSNVAAKLSVPLSDFRLFHASNGRYLIARASQVSYPKAERLAEESKNKGITDAFVGSTIEWTDVSDDFAVILASAGDKDAVPAELSSVATKLGVQPSDFRLFRASNGAYLIARASQVSYSKAERLAEELKKQGFGDAFVGLTTEWTDVSNEFSKSPER